MKLVLALVVLSLLAACAPAWTPYEAKHPKASLFLSPLPARGYAHSLPPI